jgi:thioredoxin-related protein
MKKIYLFLLLIPLGSFIYYISSTESWLINFEEAKQESKQTGKPILLYFSGSDWCGPCIKLKKEMFDSETFKEYASSHLILMQADFPRTKKNQPDKSTMAQNEALAEKYNTGGVFPRVLLLNGEGKVLKEWNGYINEKPEVFIEHLKECKPLHN